MAQFGGGGGGDGPCGPVGLDGVCLFELCADRIASRARRFDCGRDALDIVFSVTAFEKGHYFRFDGRRRCAGFSHVADTKEEGGDLEVAIRHYSADIPRKAGAGCSNVNRNSLTTAQRLA
ncbi:MAG: hypothetical protein HXY21_01105 [Parvularculaceae bacterium]|nr:hypothetical protein [Parvularculaceae bacterium]